MANAGVRGRPIAPLVLSSQERAYLERRVTALPGRYLSDADGISLLTHLGLQAVGRGQDTTFIRGLMRFEPGDFSTLRTYRAPLRH